MAIPSEPPPADLTQQLPRDAYWLVVRTLHTSLPPPDSDDAEAIARRQRGAIAQVASLLPVTAAEAQVAVRSVAADAQAHDCLRLARLTPADADGVLRCTAQAAGMWRQADSALRLLQRMQTARTKRDADPVGANQAAWAEHCALGLMIDALQDEPTAPRAAATPPDPPAPAAEPAPTPAPIADAEFSAAAYPERTTVIRRRGQVPGGVTSGPPDDDIAPALATGRTPSLLALDRTTSHPGGQRLTRQHLETIPQHP